MIAYLRSSAVGAYTREHGDSEMQNSSDPSVARADWTEAVLDVLALRTSVASTEATLNAWKGLILDHAIEGNSDHSEFESVIDGWISRQMSRAFSPRSWR